MRRGLTVLLLSLAACGGTTSGSADASILDTSSSVPGLDAGAPEAFSVQLPACRWPASLNPVVPDGGVVAWAVSRTIVACGCSADSGNPCQVCSSDGGACGLPDVPSGPCVLGCFPNEYAVGVVSASALQMPGSPDADIVEPPSLPTGCGQAGGAFLQALESMGFTAGTPTFSCCPCE